MKLQVYQWLASIIRLDVFGIECAYNPLDCEFIFLRTDERNMFFFAI